MLYQRTGENWYYDVSNIHLSRTNLCEQNSKPSDEKTGRVARSIEAWREWHDNSISYGDVFCKSIFGRGTTMAGDSETKKCIECDQEIGKSETTCPKCGADLAELEQEMEVVSRANRLLEKRKAQATPTPITETPTAPKKKTSIFSSLGKRERYSSF